jgi:hypothetical protein
MYIWYKITHTTSFINLQTIKSVMMQRSITYALHGKFLGYPQTGCKGTRWGGWSIPCPGRCSRRKETRYPLYRRLGGPQGQSGQVQKILPPPGFDPQTSQRVVSHYTDYTIPAHCTVGMPPLPKKTMMIQYTCI